jgi:hypothetical protein
VRKIHKRFDSIDSLKEFAGNDYEEAVDPAHERRLDGWDKINELYESMTKGATDNKLVTIFAYTR